ncbi:MAG: hypothetical protein V7K92_03535 [Nostoc sp.]
MRITHLRRSQRQPLPYGTLRERGSQKSKVKSQKSTSFLQDALRVGVQLLNFAKRLDTDEQCYAPTVC